MADSFLSQLQQYRADYYRDQQEIQANVDEKGVEDAAEFQEQEDLRQGAILKGVIAEGNGVTPVANDLVYVHLRIGKEGVFVWSTRQEDGGPGQPQPFILGKSQLLLKGVELALLAMQEGERAALEIKPTYAYMHKDWKAEVPAGLRRGDTLTIDVELVKVIPGSRARVVQQCDDTYRISVKHNDEWEMPRKPYKVSVQVEPCDFARIKGLDVTGPPTQLAMTDAVLQVTLGSGELPPGLDAALHSITRGEQCIVDCPASAARGGSAVKPHVEGSSRRAQFIVRLVDITQVRDLTGDGQVVKEILTKGTGLFPIECPVEDSYIQLHYRVYAHGDRAQALYDTRSDPNVEGPAVFDTGMATVPDVIDMGSRLMLVGETALVTSTWKHSYAGRTDAPEGVREGDVLDFEIELLGFQRDQILDDTPTAQRLRIAEKWKEQGNVLYKAGHLKLAKAKYLKAAKTIDRITSFDDESMFKTSQDIQISCYLNMALCAQKQKEAAESLHYCNKALELDSSNVKAYFRRAAASALTGDFESAREDLHHAAALDDTVQQDAKRKLARFAAEERAQAQKQRKEFGSFFKK